VKIPRFELTRVDEEDTREPPQIVQVTQLPWETQIDRRGFLIMAGVALAASSRASAKENTGKSAETSPDLCEEARAHLQGVNDLVISPDGKRLISGGRDWSIKLWGLQDGALVKTLKGLEFGVNSVAISSDGKLLASGSGGGLSGTISLWSLPDGALVKTLEGHKSSVLSVAISPDGKLLGSGSWDKTIRLWSLPDGELVKTLEGHIPSPSARTESCWHRAVLTKLSNYGACRMASW
jgi:WD40 repeat protein